MNWVADSLENFQVRTNYSLNGKVQKKEREWFSPHSKLPSQYVADYCQFPYPLPSANPSVTWYFILGAPWSSRMGRGIHREDEKPCYINRTLLVKVIYPTNVFSIFKWVNFNFVRKFPFVPSSLQHFWKDNINQHIIDCGVALLSAFVFYKLFLCNYWFKCCEWYSIFISAVYINCDTHLRWILSSPASARSSLVLWWMSLWVSILWSSDKPSTLWINISKFISGFTLYALVTVRCNLAKASI